MPGQVAESGSQQQGGWISMDVDAKGVVCTLGKAPTQRLPYPTAGQYAMGCCAAGC